MSSSEVRAWRTPREQDLRLLHLANPLGLDISVLPNGALFAIEHRTNAGATLLSQVLGSPIGGGIARILLRSHPSGSGV